MLFYRTMASRGLCWEKDHAVQNIADRPNPRWRKKRETSGLELCSHGRSSLPSTISVSMRACPRARRRCANSCGEGLNQLLPNLSNLLGHPDQRGGLGSVGFRDVIEIGRHLTEAKA